MTNRLIQPIAIVSLIILISLYTAFPSFKLALFGDDWQQIYNYFHYLGPKASLIEHATYFIGGYGAFEIMTGLLYSTFGDNYKMYYIFSYLYKLIAAFSVWPLIFYLTRSKLAVFYGSLFLSVTIIGLESTNWVINSPAYLAVANLSLFLYFFIKSRENLKIKSFLAAILFFYLAHIFAPIRMTGLLLFTFFLELFLYFRSPNLKLSTLRVFFILMIFIFISFTGASAERTGILAKEAFSTISSGISQIDTALNKGRSDFLFYPIITVGRIIIPNTFNPPIIIILFGLILFISIMVLNIPKVKKFIPGIMIIIVVDTAVAWMIYSVNKSTLFVQDAKSLLTGGYFLILGTILIILNLKEKISILFFIGTFWTIFSFIFPWIRAPETLHPTEQRYLVASALGVAVFCAGIIGLGKLQKNRAILFLLVLPLILINIISTRAFFFAVVEYSHGSEAMNKMWSSFPYIPEIGKSAKPILFYFASSPNKQVLKHHSLTFGFPYRMAMAYNIHEDDIFDSLAKMPFAVNDWKDVVAAVSDPKYSKGNDFTKSLVPIENVYAFYLDDNNNLINITQEARNKLKEEAHF